MKYFITALSFLLTTYAFAQQNGNIATVTCDFSAISNSVVEKVEITSVRKNTAAPAPKSEGLTLYYKSGSTETLLPIPKTDQFGEPIYLAEIPFKKGRNFFRSPQVGDIYLDVECYYAPGIPWERCQSQGSHAHGQYSGVKMNVGGVVAHKLCDRVVEDY